MTAESPSAPDHLAEDTLATMALGHACIALLFGAGLIYSGLQGNDSTSASYVILQQVPYWPTSVGIVYLSLGLLQLASRAGKDRLLLSALTFAGMSATSGLYGGLFQIGTSTTPNAFLGPQVIYFGVAFLHSAHGAYAFRAWLRNAR